MLRKLIAFSLCLVMAVSTVSAASAPAAENTSLFPTVNTYQPFSDTGTHWALPYIKLCYETGLMKGQGGNRFAPDVSISNAEIATLAARIHAAIHNTSFDSNTTPWYKGAVAYLTSLDIKMGSPNANATRQGFFDLLSAVVPDHMLLPINSIKMLPDTTDAAVLKFYNAGILTGTDQYGTFDGAKPLTRAECAAMAARVVDSSLRRYFTPAGQVPAAPFSDDTVMVTVNTSPITYVHFSETMLSLMEETQDLFLQYGLIFSWEENYGNDQWNWNSFFKSATVHSVAAEVLAAAKAAELGCAEEELALTLFGTPSQAELDAYAAEHDITTTSPNAKELLIEMVLDEKLNAELGKWVDTANVVTTPAYDKLDPKEIWEIYH